MAPRHPPFDGERFRAERKAAGYTAGEFAVLVGRTRQTLRNYEVGRSRPSPATVERIGQVLGVDHRIFYEEQGLEQEGAPQGEAHRR